MPILTQITKIIDIPMLHVPRNNSSYKNELKQIPLFHKLEDNILDRLTENSFSKIFPKGQIIYLHEETSEYFYIIKSGWVKIFRETFDGQEAIIDIINDGHIFGETHIFHNYANNASAMAIENSEVITIPLKILSNILNESSHFAYEWLKFTNMKQAKQEMELEHHLVQTAPQRIGCFLLRLCPLNANNPIILNLPYDKNLVASRLGMKAETFSRGLHKLKEGTNIDIKGSTITIHDINSLSSFCCSGCSSSYPCQDLK